MLLIDLTEIDPSYLNLRLLIIVSGYRCKYNYLIPKRNLIVYSMETKFSTNIQILCKTI